MDHRKSKKSQVAFQTNLHLLKERRANAKWGNRRSKI